MKRKKLGIGLLAAVFLASGCSAAKSRPPKQPAAAGGQYDALVVSEFILGTGDELMIEVYRQDDLKRALTVDLSGKIMFPLIGDLQAAGRSVFALRDEMAAKLSRYFLKPQVSISVTAIKSRKTMVLGEVRAPGYFVIDTDLSVLDMLSKAGGTTNDANLEKVLLIRRADNKTTEITLNIKKALSGADSAANVAIRSGDVVVVPSKRIADIARYLSYVSQIISPIVTLEGGIVLAPLVSDVFTGSGEKPNVSIPTK